MIRVPSEDHLLELHDGRTVGYVTWGDPVGMSVFIGHGTPGSRLDRYPALDDPEWIRKRGVRFVGVDRPGYGYSGPWPEASLLGCAGDFVRVADDLGIERFAALGVSGGAPYVIALGALTSERIFAHRCRQRCRCWDGRRGDTRGARCGAWRGGQDATRQPRAVVRRIRGRGHGD